MIFLDAKKFKKDVRKAPGYVADTLGPALFSTPDIIRRVGSSNDGKVPENAAALAIPSISTPGSSSVSISSTASSNIGISLDSDITQNTVSNVNKKIVSSVLEQPVQSESQLNLYNGNNIISEKEEQKSEIKPSLPEDLSSSLDSGNIANPI
jgi:hypothetical protein